MNIHTWKRPYQSTLPIIVWQISIKGHSKYHVVGSLTPQGTLWEPKCNQKHPKICKLQHGQKCHPRAEFGIWHNGSSVFDGIVRFWAFGLAKIAGKAIFIKLLSAPPITIFCNASEKTGNRWHKRQYYENSLTQYNDKVEYETYNNIWFRNLWCHCLQWICTRAMVSK